MENKVDLICDPSPLNCDWVTWFAVNYSVEITTVGLAIIGILVVYGYYLSKSQTASSLKKDVE